MEAKTRWRPASFRGAPFFVKTFERSGGRRGPNHEFPNKEQGVAEDTGKKTEGYSINAYVATSISDPDYAARRDVLIDALNKPDSGELNHPVFGAVRVQLRSWSESESDDRLGIGVFSLTFVEAGDNTYPTAQRSAAAGMPALSARAHTASANTFLRNFNISGKSDFLTAAAQNAFDLVGNAYSRLAGMSALPINFAPLMAALQQALLAAVQRDNGLAVPSALADFPRAVTGWYEAPWESRRNDDGTYRNIARLRGNGPLAPEAASILSRLFGYAPDVAISRLGATTRRMQYTNSVAVAALARQSAIIESARVAPFVDWRTLHDAETARDKITDALDREAEEADDELFIVLSDMRNLVMQTAAPDNGKLPALLDYVPGMTLPTLRLSHNLYGTAERAEELAAINGLRHPGFVPGSTPVRILSNVW